MVFYRYMMEYRFDWTSEEYIGTFEAGWGAYVRHPEKDQTNNGFGAYYKNPWDGVVSRDQITGLLGCLIEHKERYAVFRIFIHSLAWLGLFTYNTRRNGRAPSKTP